MILKPVVTYNSSIEDCLKQVLRVISSIDGNSGNGILLDLSEVSYPSPSFVIPLFTYFLQRDQHFDIKLSEILQKILFPKGLLVEGLRSLLFKSKLNDYINEDSLPIIIFPSKATNEEETSNLMSILECALYTQLGVSTNIVSGLRYIIGEIIDNVTQHSGSPKTIFFSTINRDFDFLELAISDMGIGLLGSYIKNKDEDILSDIEALQAANRGISTKNLPSAENRGFGITTSRKMIIHGLKGQYCMISGNSLVLSTPSFNQYMDFAEEYSFKGTTVIFKIPLEMKSFNYINYLE